MEQSLKEQVDRLRIDAQAINKSKDDEVDSLKREAKRQEETFLSKLQSVEGTSTQNQRKLKEVVSEHEKEKALMDQKILYLEEQLSEKGKREEAYMSELKNSKRELQTESRDLQAKFED